VWSSGIKALGFAVALFVWAGCATGGRDEKVETDAPGPIDKLTQLREEAVAHPDDPGVFYRLGNAQADIGNYPSAVEAYQQSLRLDPAQPAVFGALARSLAAMGNLKAAAGACEYGLELDPDDAQLYAILLDVARKAGDETRMIRALRNLARLETENRDHRVSLAGMLYQRKNYEEAAQLYETLADAVPENTAFRFALGRCWFALERWAAAEAAWRGVLKQDPAHASAAEGLAVLYWRMADYERAWRMVDYCLERGVALEAEFIRTLQQDSGRMRP
jgi:tetratricopeptide (TPR) repeat protein